MKRCPKCNRTYQNDAQKFCTKDGTSLVGMQSGALGETVRLDSTDLRRTKDNSKFTKVISREFPKGPPEEFDPYKPIVARPANTTGDLNTGELMRASIPPQPAPPLPPPPDSGRIAPPPPDSGRIASPPQPSSPPPQVSGPIGTPSQKLQDPNADVGQLPLASFAPPPLAQSGHLPTPQAVPGAAPPVAAPPVAAPPVAVKKRSKLPLVLGILAVLFIFGIGALAAAYWFVAKPWL